MPYGNPFRTPRAKRDDPRPLDGGMGLLAGLLGIPAAGTASGIRALLSRHACLAGEDAESLGGAGAGRKNLGERVCGLVHGQPAGASLDGPRRMAFGVALALAVPRLPVRASGNGW